MSPQRRSAISKQSFEAELSWLHRVQQLRNAALQDRCRGLAAKPRIHAALEDNALDLLYPSAKDELHDLMQTEQQPAEQEAGSLHARFYRFLNVNGAVLPPPNPDRSWRACACRRRAIGHEKVTRYTADGLSGGKGNCCCNQPWTK